MKTLKGTLLQQYLSLDKVTITGSNLEQVISEPMTGASREIARRIVIRYK